MNIPKSIAIVPDGNRRFAKRLLKRPWKGHEWGVEKLKQVIKWSQELGIKTITFYTLSLENLEKRPKIELDFLIRIAKKEINNILSDENSFVFKDKIRVYFLGNMKKLPEDMQEGMKKLMEKTKHHDNFRLNLAVAYGGRQEIINACKRISKDSPATIDEKTFRTYLETNGTADPDLVIRTGGEKRLSNFLLFQSAYSELAFVDPMWPEFTKEDFNKVIEDFSERERRFGK
ncbi:MAG: di-trans,poly-cis-decaprenylcistransferase [Candidatus Aenigmarchaeota archaeon]|nr:di-trans,poly-cis-decaprenylcistransferase [Candidatus Aenigmarchaeota archaeon]